MKTQITTKQWIAIGRLRLIVNQLDVTIGDLPKDGWWGTLLVDARNSIELVLDTIEKETKGE